jgi:DNA-directed RNA polymerase specialized sigma subunit
VFTSAKILRLCEATAMALIVEVIEVVKGVYQVTTTQSVDEEGNGDWGLVQRLDDERSADALERMEVRELLQVLLERTPLAPREREVINLILQGEDDFAEIARKLGLTRSRVWGAFRSAIKKLRKTAHEWGIVP